MVLRVRNAGETTRWQLFICSLQCCSPGSRLQPQAGQDGGLEPGAASDTFRCEGRSQVGHQTLFWEQRVELSHQLWANEFRVKLDLGLELQGGGRAWAPPG